MADQLAHAVVMPQTIRPMQARVYSNLYQMHEMQGCYSGINTLDVTDLGRYEVTSKLRDNNQHLTILGWKDIRGLLTRQMRNGLIPTWLGEMLLGDAEDEKEVMVSAFERERAANMRNVDKAEWWEHYCAGATRITFSDAIKLQGLLDENGQSIEVMVSSCMRGTSNPATIPMTIIGCWPVELVWVHVGNKHGAYSPPLKVFKVNHYDTWYLWFLLAMMVSVPLFWVRVVLSLRADDKWPGRILLYATQHCLSSRKQRPSNNSPYSKQKTIAELMVVTAGWFANQLFTVESFSEIVSLVPGVH
jgi:hypothetical protein